VLTPANGVLLLSLGVGLMLTQSRGSMLAAVGAALTLALGQARLHHRGIALAACVALFAGLVVAAMKLDPAGMENRWNSTVGKGSLAGATAGRSEILRTARYMLHDNWIAGIGAGQFDVAYQEYSTLAKSDYNNSQEAQAHSAYLKIPVEGGLVATLLMICFYLSLWVGASRLPPGQQRAVARAVVVYLLLSQLSSEGIEKESWIAVGQLFAWFWEQSGRRSIPRPPHRARSAEVPSTASSPEMVEAT
jgi:O-antigen ligase